MKVWKHFKTITYHKWLVLKGCFRIGLYKQGLLHDLSKYSITEFGVGAKYYQGDRSPNNAEREAYGYSKAWLHHQGRNKHHYEYWHDYCATAEKGVMVPVPMPDKYIAEMLMDRIAASKVYNGVDYRDDAPLKYFLGGKKNIPIHVDTGATLEMLLTMLATEGETKTFQYVKNDFLRKGKKKDGKPSMEKGHFLDENTHGY